MDEKKVYLPEMKSTEEMEVDESVYIMRHQAATESPCLSFDIIQDNLGDTRETYPMTMYLVAGTQSPNNKSDLLVMKMSNLHKTQTKTDTDEESSESEEDEDEIKNPKMNVIKIKHQGCVNRVRSTKIGDSIFAATWSELGKVSLWDLNEPIRATENSVKSNGNVKPVFTFKGHSSEGYGLDWCTTEVGTLASGDCKGHIHVWKLDGQNQTWQVDQRPYNSHAPHSVEDLQWSPNERCLLASCSVDKSIKIWDTRVSPQSACMLTATDAHTSDVNVISWNKKESQFLLSGGDDGLIRVWDLRQFNANGASPMATFKQHTAPVTTVEWHPQEATVFASGGADDQITLWDLAVEADESEKEDENIQKLPPQLLFIHQGIEEVKELHWHPQCPSTVISTALSGFDVFRTFNV